MSYCSPAVEGNKHIHSAEMSRDSLCRFDRKLKKRHCKYRYFLEEGQVWLEVWAQN